MLFCIGRANICDEIRTILMLKAPAAWLTSSSEMYVVVQAAVQGSEEVLAFSILEQWDEALASGAVASQVDYHVEPPALEAPSRQDPAERQPQAGPASQDASAAAAPMQTVRLEDSPAPQQLLSGEESSWADPVCNADAAAAAAAQGDAEADVQSALAVEGEGASHAAAVAAQGAATGSSEVCADIPPPTVLDASGSADAIGASGNSPALDSAGAVLGTVQEAVSMAAPSSSTAAKDHKSNAAPASVHITAAAGRLFTTEQAPSDSPLDAKAEPLNHCEAEGESGLAAKLTVGVPVATTTACSTADAKVKEAGEWVVCPHVPWLEWPTNAQGRRLGSGGTAVVFR